MREKDPAEILAGIRLPGHSPGEERSNGDTATRLVLEDYRPLWESLERRLATAMWDQAGSTPFLRGDVPYVVNNAGWAASAAARVLLASCEENDDGRRPVAVLELGAGLGLFARQLLDEFRRRCQEAGRDHYDRLIYHVTDASMCTVKGWTKTGLFADHPDHVVVAQADACAPLELTGTDGRPVAVPRLTAVFGNYVLDNLPSSVVRMNDGRPEQLHARTSLDTEQIPLGVRAKIPALDELPRIAAAVENRQLAQLLPLLPWMELECRFLDKGTADLPYVEEALGIAAGAPRIILSHGAIDCLTACVEALRAGGFALIRDYGPVNATQAASVAMPGRFGESWAMPVNFSHLDRRFGSRGVSIERPESDEEPSVHARLLVRGEAPRTASEFVAAFSDRRFLQAEGRVARATEMINARRFGDALETFREGLEYYADDWHLLGHAAQFLNQQLLHHDKAMALARRALAINPDFSSFLWNTLGNCLFSMERFDEANEAYERALSIDPADPQVHLNFAYVWDARGDRARALGAIARGLECDVDGRFRTALLEKQRSVLHGLDTEMAARTATLERRGNMLARDE